MTATDAAAVAIAGMHRSGTSLVAGLLGRAGIPIGRDLLGASATNPHGHHEDRAFVGLHDRALAALGTSWTLDGAPPALSWSEATCDEARALAAARGVHGAWAWKDPRTTLFLHEWKRVLPGLKVIVVFRDAATVAASLRRRRDTPLVHRFHGAWPLRRLGLPMTRDAQCLRMWRRYNEAALAFANTHPSDCAFIDAQRVRESWSALDAWLAGAGIRLGPIDPGEAIDSSLLRSKAPIDLAIRSRTPAIRRIERALAERAIA